MKRLAVALLVAVALIATGCGSTKSSTSGNGLDAALTYVPKGAPLVIAIDTNPDGGQWKQVNKLIAKFPFGGQVKQAIKAQLESRSNVSYDKDIKPLLGNDLVVVVSSFTATPGTATPYVLAWKVKDEARAKKLLTRDSSKVGTAGGTDLYRSRSGTTFSALKNGTLIATSTQAGLEAMLHRASSGDHMTVAEFNNALGDLKKDALVRITGDFQSLLSGPHAAAARKIPWVGALRTFAATLSAEPDGIVYDARELTAGNLRPQDLPLAPGAQPAPVIRRAGEIGFGVRNPSQIIRFGESVARLSNPAGYAKYAREKARVGRQLGIDVDRDLIGQLTGNATVSVAIDGGFAMRADMRDPAAAEATLRRAAPRIRKAANGKPVDITAPANGKGFYTVGKPNGKKIVFGVVGKSFVVATDAARAAAFAGASPSVVQGATGSVVIASDARALANAIAQRQGKGAAAQLFTAALGDLIGSVETESTGITGSLKLFIR